MKKVFVALIAAVLIALVGTAAHFVSSTCSTAPVLAELTLASHVTVATPATIAGIVAPRGASIPNYAMILALDSFTGAPIRYVSRLIDKRELHGSTLRAHILWCPSTNENRGATAARQRTRAVQV